MTKDELIEAVLEQAGLESKAQAQRAVNAVFSVITDTLAKGGDLGITGFGTFLVTHAKARTGINPKTGEKIQIPATTRPKFRAGKSLKEAVK